MSKLDIQAGAEDDPEDFEDRQSETHGSQDYQMVLRRLKEFVDAALKSNEKSQITSCNIARIAF